jgi:hypothetical protein
VIFTFDAPIRETWRRMGYEIKLCKRKGNEYEAAVKGEMVHLPRSMIRWFVETRGVPLDVIRGWIGYTPDKLREDFKIFANHVKGKT